MKSIAKNFGKLNQYVGEKFGASKHELPEALKDVESKTEARKQATAEIFDSLETYLKTLEKKKEGSDKAKHIAVETLGLAMQTYGSELPEDSEYGQVLIKIGEAEQSIGLVQYDFTSRVREEYMKTLQEYMSTVKEYKHIKSKLENRRLDYDAKLNRNQKSKKEKPEWEEELIVAQRKYEESLGHLETVMMNLNNRDEEQRESLLALIDAQEEYYRKSHEIILKCKEIASNPSVKGTRLETLRMMISPVKNKSTASFDSNNPFNASANASFTSPAQQANGRAVAAQGEDLNPFANAAGSSNEANLVSQNMRDPEVASAAAGFAAGIATAPPTPARPTLKQVKASFDFKAENAEEMDIKAGDIITVLDDSDSGWWKGQCNGRYGLFPSNYCEQI